MPLAQTLLRYSDFAIDMLLTVRCEKMGCAGGDEGEAEMGEQQGRGVTIKNQNHR